MKLNIKKRTWLSIHTCLALFCCFAEIVPTFASPAPQSFFDPADAITGLEAGEATLIGRPSASRKALPSSGKSKIEQVYSKNEVVYLLPFSPFIQSLVTANANNKGVLIALLAPAQEYSARVLTDDNGYFVFRGLKPGRYLLLTAVPYKAAVTIREDTGKTRTETQYNSTPIFGAEGFEGFQLESSTSITSPIYRYRDAVTDLEHRIIKIVDVKADQTVTNLGEIQ
jgi:hypothetical protein